MERRDFIKLSALTGATAALAGCGHPEHQLIRFVPDEELIPGIATWKPTVCPACTAGCGMLARVMEGEAEVVRNGQRGLMKMGLVKKLEGIPGHPVNKGKLCALGQAAIQITYHPDRLTDPMKRTGPRGSAQFTKITWEEALGQLSSQLSALVASGEARSLEFLTRPLAGKKGELASRFLAALGAPPPVVFELFEESVLRRANELSFGRPQLPTFDLARTNYLIAFGADFLGTWNSPVAHTRAYGEMRQGRAGARGKFVQVEARMSQTGANADEWIPAKPGTEGIVALGLAHVILKEKLLPAAMRAGTWIEGWPSGLPQYTPEEVEKRSGVAAETLRRLAREMAAHRPAVAVIGGAPLAQTNGLFNALAVNALNALLGSVGQPGGVSFTPASPLATEPAFRSWSSVYGTEGNPEAIRERVSALKILLLYEANPVYATPAAWKVKDALEKIPFIASFGSFLDETSVLADLILPDHSFLESWAEAVAESGATTAVHSVAAPAMHPLHNTRAMPDVLLSVARQIGGKVAKALPWESYEEMLRKSFESVRPRETESSAFWKSVVEKGGWWGEASAALRTNAAHSPRSKPPAKPLVREPAFDGAAEDYPFHFLPFASQTLGDGSLAHLPWLQETPDVLSTAMWGTWVEINPKSAERLGIRQGDLVEVSSSHGKLRAPALLSPGIAPDVIAMPAGQGHEQFTRYASGRGANPISILAPAVEPETGALAWAATRVKAARAGQGRLVLFAGGMREDPNEHEQR